MFLREVHIQMLFWEKYTHGFIANTLSANVGLVSYPMNWVAINNFLLSYLRLKAEINR